METQISMAENMLAKKHWSFLIVWSVLNLLGWGVGLFIVFKIYSIFDFIKPSTFFTMVAWLPFGASIGILQWIKLRQISVNLYKWVVVSAIGFSVPPSLFYWATNLTLHRNNHNIFYGAIFIITILINGASIGVLQSSMIKKYVSRPELWIRAYIFWLLLLLGSMWFIGFQESLVLKIYSFLRGFLNLISFGFSFELIIGLIITLTTLGLSVPTGYILLKYSNINTVTIKAG